MKTGIKIIAIKRILIKKNRQKSHRLQVGTRQTQLGIKLMASFINAKVSLHFFAKYLHKFFKNKENLGIFHKTPKLVYTFQQAEYSFFNTNRRLGVSQRHRGHKVYTNRRLDVSQRFSNLRHKSKIRRSQSLVFIRKLN